MAFNLSGFSSMIMSWVSTLWFWAIIILAIGVGLVIVLSIRKKMKLTVPVREIVDFGHGKIGERSHKGGWFRTKVFLGIYDYGGEEVFKLKDGRIVQELSTEDYQEIDGKKGIFCARKGDDFKILLPIGKFKFDDKSQDAMMSIAPADFREVSVKLKNQVDNEVLSKMEKWLPILSYAIIGILFIVGLIIIFQINKSSLADIKEMVLQVAQRGCEGAKDIIASSAP